MAKIKMIGLAVFALMLVLLGSGYYINKVAIGIPAISGRQRPAKPTAGNMRM